MDRLVTKEYYNQLIDRLIAYEDQYYNEDRSSVSDAEFDSLYREAEEIEKHYPKWIREDSPVHKVMGKATKGLREIVHEVPMLSLSKAMDKEELRTSLWQMYRQGVTRFSVECKHDGLACRLKYENGKFVLGATRGNGRVGNDVTLTCNQISNIPKEISYTGSLDIRGEIFLTKTGLEEINQYLLAKNPNAQLKKNVRNTASGLLRDENPDINKSSKLKFSAYMDASQDSQVKSHSEAMKQLSGLGFDTTDKFVPFKIITMDTPNQVASKQCFDKGFDELSSWLDEVYAKRETLDFDIDGMVIKADKYVDQEKLGVREHSPKWAIAYKFPQEEKMSILRGVSWELGPKGAITPVGIIDPVDILGATVTNPTLHNIDEIRRLDMKIGDHITVTRRGDVIPKVIRVHKDLRTGNEEEIIPPNVCPVCGGQVTKQDVYIRCDNANCKGRILGKIIDFIRKTEMKDFGKRLAEQLVEAGKLTKVTDIYRLKEEDISALEKRGDVSAKKIMEVIRKSKDVTLDKVIAGLGIPNVGDVTGKILAKKFDDLNSLRNASYQELVKTGIGEVVSNDIVKWFADEDNCNIIDELIGFGIGKPLEVKKGALTGKSFAFTGALSISRKKMQEIIEEKGGVNSSIKKGIDYLIIGDGAKEAKIEKAKGYGAKVITENEFNQLC